MEQIKSTEDRILYITTKEITLLDIPRVLDELGYEVYQADFGIKAQEYEDAACRKIIAAIEEFHVDFVISYDFIQTIAQACMEADVPYIAWVYDAPQKELYTHYALYPCNYIFAFDKKQVRRLQDIGIKYVKHMPLAVHVDKIKMVTETIGKNRSVGYQEEISFIGQLYKFENEDTVLGQMDENIRQQLYQNIDSCFMKWDKDTHMHGIMSEECVEYLGSLQGHRVKKSYPYMSEQLFYETAILSRMLAYRERVHILNMLAEDYDVTLYTHDKNTSQLSKKVKIKPGMPYDVLSHAYRRSKINLNISLHCIETGVPQRVLDVMAAGAFMLSNYQEELEEMFVPGEEIVFYHNEQELKELVAYYLAHDEEREQIARKGQKKVLQEYSYHKALKKVLQDVNEAEQNRKESYLSMQRKEMRKQVDFLLAQKKEQSYQQLYELCKSRVYETTISKTTDLHILGIMAEIWYGEKMIGIPCIFDDVDNIQQAEQKYLELKHGLWRIEQGLSYEICMDAVENIRQRSISKFFIAKIICMKLRDKESTIAKLAELMSETSVLDAIEMLTYGLLFLEGDSNLLIQKAQYLMKLNLWEEALEVLQTIEEPTEEVKRVISDLSETLHRFK